MLSLFDELPVIVWTLDTELHITSSPGGGLRALGVQAGEDVGKHFFEALGTDDPEFPPIAACRRALAGETVRYELDWKGLSYETRVTPLRGADGQVVGCIGVSQDISDRKRLQAQTVQIENLEAVARLAGGVAHDFNNLLTVILGNCEILLRTMPQPNSRNLVEEVQAAGQRAAGLTGQLLAFSQNQIVAPEVLNLNHLVTVLKKTLEGVFCDGVELAMELAADLCNVKADPAQLEQVILNLAFNARDAMPGGGLFTLATRNLDFDPAAARFHAEAKPGGYVVLTATDTGCGMAEATIARVFEPFFTTKPEGKGIGLGLSMIHGIVRQSGGFIAIASKPGNGTKFEVYLPRSMEADPKNRAATTNQVEPSGETILLAEDQPGVRALAARFLRQHGFTVLEATNGEEAMQISSEHTGAIHLLLTDLTMPGLSGRELANHLDARRPEMKVILMSGHLADEELRRGIERLDTAFLQKPFTSASLVQLVREVLRRPV